MANRFAYPFCVVVLLAVTFSEGKVLSAKDRPPADGKDLPAKLDQIRAEHGLPALWAGKFYTDGRSEQAVSGVRKWKHEAAAEVEDVIHLGSCTKAMTAVMVAQLCSEGKLSFETPLTEIFPEVQGLAESEWGEVTVRQLLEHQSGVPANAIWWTLHKENPDDPMAARAAMLRWLLKYDRPKKRKFLYSNVGYALLGHIVETIEGEPWESLIETKIFQPLGITSGGHGPVGEPAKNNSQQTDNPGFAWGHIPETGITELVDGLQGKTTEPSFKPLNTDNAPPLGPAGRVHMTMADWSKFVLLFAGGQVGNPAGPEKLGIKPEIWASLLESKSEGNYAGGWLLLERDWAAGRVLHHNGSNTTWYCVAFVPVGKDYCLLAATNSAGPKAGKACDQAVQAAMKNTRKRGGNQE
ncbi:MAG: serine hydrolase domain-containing protein [Pirellulaceae bacterium]